MIHFSYLYVIGRLPGNKQLCIATINNTIKLHGAKTKFEFFMMDTLGFRIRWVGLPDFIPVQF